MKKASGEELGHALAFFDALWRFLKLGAGAGFEPASTNAQVSGYKEGWQSRSPADTQLSAQFPDAYLHDLASVAAAWPKLKPELREAILAIIASVGPRV